MNSFQLVGSPEASSGSLTTGTAVLLPLADEHEPPSAYWQCAVSERATGGVDTHLGEQSAEVPTQSRTCLTAGSKSKAMGAASTQMQLPKPCGSLVFSEENGNAAA